MILVYKNLRIRNAESCDAEQLCVWWNDGKVMAHAGFPNGLHETAKKIRESIAADSDETGRRHIIELNGIAIGEMNYRNKGGGAAEIGIKICDPSEQNKGYGTMLLSMFADALFQYYGYRKIVLDTNMNNKRAQYVYEKKMGFRYIGTRENSWQNQLGEYQSSMDFELKKSDWLTVKKSPACYIHIRRENPADYHAVENLAREAFWINTDAKEFINEHLLTHKLRESPSYIPELDYLAEISGELAGHVIYSLAKIVDKDNVEHEILNFGPLSVLPKYQGKNVGRALMEFTIAEAKRLGYKAIAFFGHPDYYPRFGFHRAGEYGLTTPDGGVFDAFMAMELQDGALRAIGGGRYYEDSLFGNITDEETRAFDKNFPEKEHLAPAYINVLLERLEPDARAAIESQGFTYLRDVRGLTEKAASQLPGIDGHAKETIRDVMKERGSVWGEGHYNQNVAETD